MSSAALTLAIILLPFGCGDDDSVTDGGSLDAAPDATTIAVEPAQPPSMGPCPDGWLEETGASGAVECTPYGGGAAAACGSDEAHFADGMACVRLGSECPADGLPADLPAGSTVIYVLAGSSGDGSRANPFGTIADALRMARSNTTVAIGRGSYAEEVSLPSGVTLWGTCVREAIVTNASPSVRTGVITTRGRGGVVRNLRVEQSSRSGVLVGNDVDVRVQDIVIDDVQFVGAVVFGTGHLEAENVAIRNTRSLPDGSTGIGLAVLDGTGNVRRVALDANRSDGVITDGTGAMLVLEDAAIRDTRPAADLSGGRGIAVTNMGATTARRVVVDGSTEAGVNVQGPATSALDLELAVVRGTVQRFDGLGGFGIAADGGSLLDARKILVERNTATGIIAATLTLRGEDLIARETLPIEPGTAPDPSDEFGRGLELQTGSDAQLARVLLEGNTDVGAFLGGAGAVVTLEDLRVTSTRARSIGTHGRGVEVLAGGNVTLTRASLADNRDLSVVAFSDGSTLTVADLTITGSLPRECAPGSCDPAGMGIGAYLGSDVEVSRFDIRDSATCGVHVATGASLDLRDGLVSGNPIGACVQVDGYDVGRLSTDVAYQDNETNLQATTLPVPEPSGQVTP